MEAVSVASSSAIPAAKPALRLRIGGVCSQSLVYDCKRRGGFWSRIVVLWACSPCSRNTSRSIWRREDLFHTRCSSASSTNSGDEPGVITKTVDKDSGGVLEGVKQGNGTAALWNALSEVEGAVSSLPPVVPVRKVGENSKFVVGFFLVFAFLVVVKQSILRKPRHIQHGSVADLVKRGQLKSYSRGISRPLRYEDPFNNPLVKVSKSDSTVEMCGKVYQLSPVTLTDEQRSSHQRRRSRAYRWKRPTIFLKEGDEVPPDVDPDTVRWIPANHPFATTVSDIDEELAQSNVYQKNGVPFRIKAEHEALQRKLEALQRDQKLNRVAINPRNVHEFEGPAVPATSPDIEAGPTVAADHQYLKSEPSSNTSIPEERKKT